MVVPLFVGREKSLGALGEVTSRGDDREIFLTASIGLALSDPQTQLSDEIIKDAELAMYHSKRIGGDRIDVYKPAMRVAITWWSAINWEASRALGRC